MNVVRTRHYWFPPAYFAENDNPANAEAASADQEVGPVLADPKEVFYLRRTNRVQYRHLDHHPGIWADSRKRPSRGKLHLGRSSLGGARKPRGRLREVRKGFYRVLGVRTY